MRGNLWKIIVYNRYKKSVKRKERRGNRRKLENVLRYLTHLVLCAFLNSVALKLVHKGRSGDTKRIVLEQWRKSLCFLTRRAFL